MFVFDLVIGVLLFDVGWVILIVMLYKMLFVGFFGCIFVSLWGIVLFVFVVVGIVVYCKCWFDVVCIWCGYGLCVVLFDLYVWIGLWGMLWFVLFVFIGVLLGFGVFGMVLFVGVVYLG